MWCFQLVLRKYLIKNDILLSLIMKKLSMLHKKIYYSTLKKIFKKLHKVLSAYTLFLEKLLLDAHGIPAKLYST